MPSTFIAVQSLQKEYVACIDDILPGDNVKGRLATALSKSFHLEVFEHCDMKKKVIAKYINVRLHATLKDITESFSQKGRKRNKKTLMMCHEY
ncbi:hypothetical protein BaRGS_00020241 [Batillaria attramentaria]|uniref:Uncharacterized protein n=1 Tax=Batillaria attramentaria TaxID=370345 RepID=A0ABD0KMI1_9CAEN